jgi:stearoyl-CoA desaturase (delta-9 desaturase)
MKYLASTPQTLSVIQVASLLTMLLGFFLVGFSWSYIALSVLTFYAFSILGISLTLHRYYSHKSFKLNIIVKWILTAFAVLAGRGSPLGWVYIHRIHHATSDTEKDPHSPHFSTFKIVGFKPVYDESKKINYFIVKELLTKTHINIDKYYMAFILAYIVLLGVINPVLVFYMWAVPTFAVSASQVAFNYFAHMYGHRNFETKDRSTNNIYLWPFILGDAWHNNHHAHAEQVSTKVRWYEFDPTAGIISIIRSDK